MTTAPESDCAPWAILCVSPIAQEQNSRCNRKGTFDRDRASQVVIVWKFRPLDTLGFRFEGVLRGVPSAAVVESVLRALASVRLSFGNRLMSKNGVTLEREGAA